MQYSKELKERIARLPDNVPVAIGVQAEKGGQFLMVAIPLNAVTAKALEVTK